MLAAHSMMEVFDPLLKRSSLDSETSIKFPSFLRGGYTQMILCAVASIIQSSESTKHCIPRCQQCFRESFCESGEVVRLPREGADFRGSLGNFRGSLGNFRGSSGSLLISTVKNKERKPRDFPEARGSPTPS